MKNSDVKNGDEVKAKSSRLEVLKGIYINGSPAAIAQVRFIFEEYFRSIGFRWRIPGKRHSF